MLERAAGCLESGSLRRFLPGPQRALKSRRMLHSAFWSHGGREMDLSFWATLMRSSARDDLDEKSSKRIDAKSGVFLDFLYPSGAISYLRQFSVWSSDRQEVRRLRGLHAKLGHRLYTSFAGGERLLQSEDADTFQGQILLHKENTESAKKSTQERQADSARRNLLGLERNDDFEEAWRRFDLSGPSAQLDLIPRLLIYLSTSSRSIDAQRAVALFQRISESAGLEEHQAALQSYLTLGDVSRAVDVHGQILSRFGSLESSNMVFSHMIEHSQWDMASTLFTTIQSFRKTHLTKASYNMWTVMDKLPSLQDQALELASIVNKQLEGPSVDGGSVNLAMINMATMVIQRALLPKPALLHFDRAKFFSLLNVLREWDKDNDTFYERLIEKLLELRQLDFAISCYRYYRRFVKHKISRRTLNEVLEAASERQNLVAMQNILDDWIQYYEKPSREGYRLLMTAFARQSDAKTVKALFNQYLQTQHRNTPDDFPPLLHVHAKRGELSEVLEIFENMEANYGVTPNITSWNILINAYGKVGDVDGALRRFDQLLKSGLQPNAYTFGTLMGSCISRGDLAAAVDLYQMSEILEVSASIPMIDCLVLGHVQDGLLQEAEKICEDTLQLKLDGSVTRMWNYLLLAYAMRRDLDNTNRILRRMTDARVDYDESTYSALMQALVMVKQPLRAYNILKEDIPISGVKVTPFHYAVVMGGFLATGETEKVFQVHNRMMKRNIGETASTRLIALKAPAKEDTAAEVGSTDPHLAKAETIFREAYNEKDLQEFTGSIRKGFVHEPLDVAYQSAYIDFLIFVCGQSGLFQRVKELYNQYCEDSSGSRQVEPPIRMLSALMTAALKSENYERVQDCWDLAFSQAKKQGRPVRSTEDVQLSKVLPLHQLDLCQPLSRQIIALARQDNFQQLSNTIDAVQQAGFALDVENWNLYIQNLALSYKYQQAFELCENKLMSGWTGWARLRWQAPVRNRLPIQIRHLKKDPRFLRPKYHTLLFLAKGLSDLEASATESRHAHMLVEELTKTCPRVIQAIRTMERTDSELEREVMRDGDV